ncbi:hypothetical protein C2S53_003095 [Perilla frutescens var. hirtella]|uniref:Uncharacterized protein n=1 Tax=Perilla frutescens var. hirtella TaxID=608512 RepID=A0AAD4PES8_PERFH|nr:hypothetical protein C2S53_003095 [Perilla frutescens var. hirtella]
MAGGKTLTAPVTLVIQKRLFDTDLSPNNINRLFILMSRIIRDDFLMDDEKRYLQTYDRYMKKKKKEYVEVNKKKKKKKKKHIEVKIIELSLELETVKFYRWDMPNRNGSRTPSSYIIDECINCTHLHSF